MKRQTTTSSLELFLDTICNMFGGILFIAILVAIQIRETTESITKTQEPPSLQAISALQEELTQAMADIETATILRDTVKKTMPRPVTVAENQRIDDFNRLSTANEEATQIQGQLLNELLATEKETVMLENKLAEISSQLEDLRELESDLLQQEQGLKSENRQRTQTMALLETEIATLTESIARKEQAAENKVDHAQRQEILYLPKLRTSSKPETLNCVLRFNRLYDARERNDFVTGNPNELGTPKQDRGIMIASPHFSSQFQQWLQDLDPDQCTVTVFVYGESADNFYRVRDVLMEEGFEYILLPSPDDEIWTFGGKGGSRDVQ